MRGKEDRIPQRLEEIRRRFEHWRSTRARLGRIPEELWEEAVSCATRYGVHRCASVLGLEYNRLKRRLALSGDRRDGEATRPTFIELPSAVAANELECVMELHGASGAMVRLRLRGVAVEQLIEHAWRLVGPRR